MYTLAVLLVLTATPNADDYEPPQRPVEKRLMQCRRRCYNECLRPNTDHEQIDFMCFGRCIRDYCDY